MLDERMLNDIQNLFVNIRAHSKDKIILQDSLIKIEEKRSLVNCFSTAFQKDIFIYCFDNIKALIEAQQYEFVFDFTDAIHNLPEIFYCKYNLKRYWKIYIEPLRRKYDKQLFIHFKNDFKGMNTNLLNLMQKQL